jgi:N-carbamoylputrescine amidase
MKERSGTQRKPITLRVAALQLVSKNGDVAGNLARATPFVERAARAGATLVLLPEFYPSGYIYTDQTWDVAETADGPTVSWLTDISRRLSIYVGTSFVEAEGDDFFNSFVLADPTGRIVGKVRKEAPATFEACFTRGERGPHVIETELGLVGVGICFENAFAFLPRLMYDRSVDLLLLPHSAPAAVPSYFTPKKDVILEAERLRDLAARSARTLGIPVVCVNKAGPWVSPLPGVPFGTQRSKFTGLSSIADSDGTILAKLGDEEGLIWADVTLDPARKATEPPCGHGRWSDRPYLLLRLIRWSALAGAVWYALSRKRRRRARAVSGGSPSSR